MVWPDMFGIGRDGARWAVRGFHVPVGGQSVGRTSCPGECSRLGREGFPVCPEFVGVHRDDNAEKHACLRCETTSPHTPCGNFRLNDAMPPAREVYSANEATAGTTPMRMKAGRKQSPVGPSSRTDRREEACSMVERSS